jgi:hypothetical protein
MRGCRIAELERQIRKATEPELTTTVGRSGGRARDKGCRREGAGCVAAETKAGQGALPASAAISAAARTFDKLKVLLDEIETEWADSQQTSARHCVSGNRRGATNPAEDRTVSAESFDETRQLPSSVDVCAHMRNNFVDTRPLGVILISNNGKRDLGCVRQCGN